MSSTDSTLPPAENYAHVVVQTRHTLHDIRNTVCNIRHNIHYTTQFITVQLSCYSTAKNEVVTQATLFAYMIVQE